MGEEKHHDQTRRNNQQQDHQSSHSSSVDDLYTESMQEERNRLREENAALRAEVAELKKELEFSKLSRAAQSAVSSPSSSSGAIFPFAQAIDTPVFGFDSKGRMDVWNQAASDLTGWSQEHVLGTTTTLINRNTNDSSTVNTHHNAWTIDNLAERLACSEERRKQFRDRIQRALSDAEGFDRFELPLRVGDDGNGVTSIVRHLLLHASVRPCDIYNDGWAVRVVAHDVSDLVEARSRLEERIKVVPSMIYEFEIDDRLSPTDPNYATFPWVSETGCQKIFEKTSAEIRDASVAISMISKRDLPAFEESVSVSHQTMEKWEWQGHILVDDVSSSAACGGDSNQPQEPRKKIEKAVSGESMPVRHGHIVRWTGTLQDVTEMVTLRQHVVQAQVLKEVFSNMQGTLAYEVDSTGKMLWLAGDTETLFGYTHDELKDMTLCKCDNAASLCDNIDNDQDDVDQIKDSNSGEENCCLRKFLGQMVEPSSMNHVEEVAEAIRCGEAPPMVNVAFRIKHHEESNDEETDATDALNKSSRSQAVEEDHISEIKWMMFDKLTQKMPDGGFLVVLHDMTSAVKLRAIKTKLKIQKAIAERFKSACAFLSHEIRNQLFPQSMVLNEMRRQERLKWGSHIDMILDANATVSHILNRVLDMARWESGEFPLDIIPFPVYRLFQAIAVFAKATASSSSNQHNADENEEEDYTSDYGVEGPSEVRIVGLEDIDENWLVFGDEHILKQAGTNLVSNGAKFCRGSWLEITFGFIVETDTKAVLSLTVRDGGKGMDQRQVNMVMEPFGQIRKAGEAARGTGLGLPLTRAMVEQGHAGTLSLQSDGPGRGCTARMVVPLDWKNVAPETEDDGNGGHGNIGSDGKGSATTASAVDLLDWVLPRQNPVADVLIVDDVPINRKVLVHTASRLGLTCQEASDGLEAVELMKAATNYHDNVGGYSVVFMDRQMPNMSGDEATEVARAAGYRGPIAMVSGDTFERHERELLLSKGVTAFLAKMDEPGALHAMQRLAELKSKKEKELSLFEGVSQLLSCNDESGLTSFVTK